MWVLGIKARLSCLEASTFTHGAILPALKEILAHRVFISESLVRCNPTVSPGAPVIVITRGLLPKGEMGTGPLAQSGDRPAGSSQVAIVTEGSPSL